MANAVIDENGRLITTEGNLLLDTNGTDCCCGPTLCPNMGLGTKVRVNMLVQYASWEGNEEDDHNCDFDCEGGAGTKRWIDFAKIENVDVPCTSFTPGDPPTAIFSGNILVYGYDVDTEFRCQPFNNYLMPIVITYSPSLGDPAVPTWGFFLGAGAGLSEYFKDTDGDPIYSATDIINGLFGTTADLATLDPSWNRCLGFRAVHWEGPASEYAAEPAWDALYVDDSFDRMVVFPKSGYIANPGEGPSGDSDCICEIDAGDKFCARCVWTLNVEVL